MKGVMSQPNTENIYNAEIEELESSQLEELDEIDHIGGTIWANIETGKIHLCLCVHCII